MKRKPIPIEEGNPRKRRKVALGRGLDALIPSGPADETETDYRLCPVEAIRPNRFQPRRRFAEAEMAELAESIRAQGVLQPLLVRQDAAGYELVAGERRWRAAKQAGLNEVPVVVKSISEAEMLEISIVENIQREDFNPIEEADAYHRLMTEFGLTQDRVAERVGKSRPAVANALRLRQLEEPIKESIISGEIHMGHARALLALESAPQRRAAWRQITAKKLSVRQAESLVRRIKSSGPAPGAPPARTSNPHLVALADELSRQFGTKVSIRRRGKRGTLAIEFYSDEDLNRLLGLLQAD
jgi:ParB family chromosome partitioning protein